MFEQTLRHKLIPGYALLVGLPVAALVLVLRAGATLSTSPAGHIPATAPVAVPASSMSLQLLVVQLAAILLASRLLGVLFRKIQQPQVMADMVAGLLLGPSLLGRVAPWASNALFPPASLGYLNALSQIGVLFFMFLVGLGLNPRTLRDHGHAAVLISHASIVIPFCLGAGAASLLYPRLATAGVSFTSFALFIGSAMSITALPVLARILMERKLLRTRIGALSISCAAVDDITGWGILAYIVALIRSEQSLIPPWVTVEGALVYVVVMTAVVKPLLRGFDTSFRRHGRLTEQAISLMLVLALLSAFVTETLGIHSLFGAFFMGVIMPKRDDFISAVTGTLESLTVVALLPMFFALSGLRTNLGMVHGRLWIYTLFIIATAIAGKFGGSMLAARIAGVSWRDASALGILMNTRGLMALVALNIGLDIGIISSEVFTIMVLMTLVTTFMTSPLLQYVYPTRPVLKDEDDFEAARKVALSS
jgi:Kef-type K+ transport system membrane component KefB